MGNATRPDQTSIHIRIRTKTSEGSYCRRSAYAALPPSSHRPHVFRCDAAARCGAVRIVRQRRQTPTTLEASYSPPEKKKKEKKIKKGNLLPCGGGGGARSSLFRDAPDVQRGEPKVKSPRTDGRPADAFFFSPPPPPPPRPPQLDSGALHVYAQHHVRQGRSLSHPVQTLAPPQAAAESRAFRPARNSARSRNYLPCGCSGTQLRIPISSLQSQGLWSEFGLLPPPMANATTNQNLSTIKTKKQIVTRLEWSDWSAACINLLGI